MDEITTSWQLLGIINKWVTLFVAIECFSMATLFIMCGWNAAKFPAYSQVRSFTMTTLGFWFFADGVVKTIRFFEAKALAFNSESIYLIFSRFGSAFVGIAAIYGLIHLYKGIKR